MLVYYTLISIIKLFLSQPTSVWFSFPPHLTGSEGVREQLHGTNFVPELKRIGGKIGEERQKEVVHRWDTARQGKASEQAKGTATLPHNCPLEKRKTPKQYQHTYFRGFLKVYTISQRRKRVEENTDDKKNNTDLQRIHWKNKQKRSNISYCTLYFQALPLSYGLDRCVSFGYLKEIQSQTIVSWIEKFLHSITDKCYNQ